jgi:hypothetical protein
MIVADTGAGGGGMSTGANAVIIGCVTAALALGLFAFFNFRLTNQLKQLQAEQAKVTEELTAATAELDRLNTLKVELDAINAQTEGFKSFFAQLQPWSAVLEDLRSRTPADVWIKNITAAGLNVTIEGGSLAFEQVNDFVLTLLQSPFVETVTLNKSDIAKGTPTTLPSVSYGITVTLKPLDLASPELKQSLAATGSEGLVEKLDILRTLEAK